MHTELPTSSALEKTPVGAPDRGKDASGALGRILLVDDEPGLRRAIMRTLRASGFAVEACGDAELAMTRLGEQTFDLVLTDIHLPSMDGLSLLRVVKERDQDLPVLIMTGEPSLDSAVSAIDGGAVNYLLKPFSTENLLPIVERAVKRHDSARAVRAQVEAANAAASQVQDLAERFESALTTFWLAAQPIVDTANMHIPAYEMLLRSAEPRLPSPLDVVAAAERLGRTPELGRRVRAQVAALFERCPPGGRLFVNLHPLDLMDELLLSGADPLCAWANRTVLEITERSKLEALSDVSASVARLKQIGFGIALDDLGAGYSGLASFGVVEPDIVKLDRSLIQNLERDATNRRVVAGLIETCRDLGVSVVAEGVETAAECEALRTLGVSLMQGYLFARPDRPFPPARF